MEDQENVETDAVIIDTPSTEENENSENTQEVEPEKELSDEELKEEIARLKEEVKLEEDAKEKRHKEQDIGWKTKIVKEREKAKVLEDNNRKAEESYKSLESLLVEEAFSKTVDDNFGLPYFENLAKTNPDLAEKVAKTNWQMTAKELILDTKRKLADDWNEKLQKEVSEEYVRMSEREKIYHELSLEQAEVKFSELDESEIDIAKEYFNDIVEGKKLTPTTTKKYTDMAILMATKGRKTEEPKKVIDKEGILADKATTWIAPKSWSKETIVWDRNAIIQQLINAWVSREMAEKMY